MPQNRESKQSRSLPRRIAAELRRRVMHELSPVAYFRSLGASIGAGVDIYGSSLFTFGTEPYLVRVGDSVTISEGVIFVTHDGGLRVHRDEHPDAFLYAPITIEDGAFIGARAVLLPGVTVGRRAVVGAGAVVARSIPAETVAVGVPARPVKSIEEYWEGARDRLISTAGLSAEEKRALLTRTFAGEPARAGEALAPLAPPGQRTER